MKKSNKTLLDELEAQLNVLETRLDQVTKKVKKNSSN